MMSICLVSVVFRQNLCIRHGVWNTHGGCRRGGGLRSCGGLGSRVWMDSQGGGMYMTRLCSMNGDGEGIVRQQGGDLSLRNGGAEVEQPSAELLELVKVQLDMLVSMLESRIRDAFEQMDMGVRCAMYCRTPSSITTRTLTLQLVATSDDRWDAPDNSTVFANEFIIGDEISADAEEAWVVNQPMIVLPDNGGLILPLTHKSFLVGLLLVERTLPNFKNVILPPIHDVFGPAEIGIIKQSGVALSMSCAMDLRAVMERAGARMQQERLQGLISQASKP